MTEITKKTIALLIGSFLIIGSGATYLIIKDDSYKPYFCEDTQLVGYCFDLSKKNDDGLQTRCYYNLNESNRYKICKSGWQKYHGEDVNGSIFEGDFEDIKIILTKSKKDRLKDIGIENPKISKVKKKENFCYFKIYEKGGINKEFKIECEYCKRYEWIEEKEICDYTDNIIGFECQNVGGEFSKKCIDWHVMTEEELLEEASKVYNFKLNLISNS